MRGLAVVNPRASSFDRPTADAALAALATTLDLEVEETAAPGDAEEIGATARDRRCDVVVVLGGDGTVNETVCGLLRAPRAATPPMVAVLPFGCVNVFSRHLGLGRSPVPAAATLADRLRRGVSRTVGAGHVSTAGTQRWFCLSVGIGFDAEVVAAVERRRAGGRPASTLLYARCGVTEFYRRGARPRMTLDLDLPGDAEAVVVGNHAPWTYAGARPIWATPQADWQRGLDVMTLHRLATVPTLRALARMVGARPPTARDGAGVSHRHDLAALAVTASQPARWQVDGDAMPAASQWRITSHEGALRVPM